MKWRTYDQYQRKYKDSQETTVKIICQQIGQPRLNKFLDIQSSKTESGRNRKSEQAYY